MIIKLLMASKTMQQLTSLATNKSHQNQAESLLHPTILAAESVLTHSW